MKKLLKEALSGHTSSHTVGPTLGGDAMSGHGYGRLKAKWHVPHQASDSFPYDDYEVAELADWWEEGEFSDDKEKKMFANKTGMHQQKIDPDKRKDLRTNFDGQHTGLAGPSVPEQTVRKYIKLMVEDAFRMRMASSEPHNFVNQFGQRHNAAGSKSGWSKAIYFDDSEGNEPVHSLKDLMKKQNNDLEETEE